jgi:hypothetical protein
LAIEVTELVDGTAAALARHQDHVWARWNRVRFLNALEERLRSKDSKELQDGPYDEYIVLIHSDEPMLDATQVEECLAGHHFPAPAQILRAYLLLSYDPHCRGYPYARLQLGPPRE